MTYELALTDHEIELLAKSAEGKDGCHYMPNKKTFDGLRKKGLVDLKKCINPDYYPNAVATAAGREILKIIQEDKDWAAKAG